MRRTCGIFLCLGLPLKVSCSLLILSGEPVRAEGKDGVAMKRSSIHKRTILEVTTSEGASLPLVRVGLVNEGWDVF